MKWLKENFAILSVVIFGVALTVPLLGGSFWWEEAHQALAGLGFTNIWTNLQPPFLYLIINCAAFFSQQEWWLRLWTALLPATLSIVGLYLLGRKLHSKKLGLLAALLLSTNSFFIYYAGELGNYAWTMTWTVFSWLFILEKQQIGQDVYQVSRRSVMTKFFNLFPISHDLFLFIACSILGLYTSYLYIFVLATQLLYLIYKKSWRDLFWTMFVTFIAYLPWLPQIVNQIRNTQTLQNSFPGFAQMFNLGILKAPALTLGKFIFGMMPIEANWFYFSVLLILAIFIGGFLYAYPPAVWRYNRRKILLLSGILFLPLVMALGASIPWPILQARRVIFLLPFFYLFIAYLLFGLQSNKKITRWSYLIFTTLLLTNLYGLFIYYYTPSLQRENWRGAIEQVTSNIPAEQTLVIFPHLADFSPWQWYAPSEIAVLSLQTRNLNLDETNRLDLFKPYLNNYRYLVVFDYLRGIVDPNRLIDAALAEADFVLLKDVGEADLGEVGIYVRED